MRRKKYILDVKNCRLTMSYVEDLVPEFDTEAYKDAIIPPMIMWAVVQLLWFLLTYVDDSVGGPLAQGIPLEMNLLFGAWVGMNMARAGSNAGDAALAGLATGIVAGILWLIFFGAIDPLDTYASSGLDQGVGDLWPMIILIALQHVVGAISIAGIMGGGMEDDGPAKKPAAKKKPAKKAVKKETTDA